jgi:hypothetical protein
MAETAGEGKDGNNNVNKKRCRLSPNNINDLLVFLNKNLEY